MTQQTRSYSIEIKDQSTERVTIFTFIDVTADELQTVLTELRRLLGEKGVAAGSSSL